MRFIFINELLHFRSLYFRSLKKLLMSNNIFSRSITQFLAILVLRKVLRFERAILTLPNSYIVHRREIKVHGLLGCRHRRKYV